MLLECPENFPDYSLIDCGDFEKLERFGQYITIRPEPQAVWRPNLSRNEWMAKAHILFEAKSSSSGIWKKLKKDVPDQWLIDYQFQDKTSIKFRLGLTSFKHTGIFPEQAVNWNYIYSHLKKIENPKFLNLFAYTGGASMAAKAAGADVVHVDSIKQVVNWANENRTHSNLSDIRWVIEDAFKFVTRELKRGNSYHGIILDPPAYGHGPNGEKWKLEEMILPMMEAVLKILKPKNNLFIINAYSLGLSAMVIENLITQNVPFETKTEVGELYLKSESGLKLPLGVFGRFKS
jgi:23S rRNA (cytosine1962-C5)-methyltransferase